MLIKPEKSNFKKLDFLKEANKYFIVFIFLNLLNGSLIFAGSTLPCIDDPMIQQKQMKATLTPDQTHTLLYLAQIEKPQKGWELLGQLGDPYAKLAAQVLNLESRFPESTYHRLIKTHWRQVVGQELMEKTFNEVALQHYRQYISIIRRTHNWPDSDQVLLSYLKAARDHKLPDLIVFDAAWDAAGYNVIRSWQSLNNLENQRTIEPSNACYKIDAIRARNVILKDFTLFMLPEFNATIDRI